MTYLRNKFPPSGGARLSAWWQGGVYLRARSYKPLPAPSPWEGIAQAQALQIPSLGRGAAVGVVTGRGLFASQVVQTPPCTLTLGGNRPSPSLTNSLPREGYGCRRSGREGFICELGRTDPSLHPPLGRESHKPDPSAAFLGDN